MSYYSFSHNREETAMGQHAKAKAPEEAHLTAYLKSRRLAAGSFLSSQPKRFALLVMMLSFLGVCLVACTAGGSDLGDSGGDSGIDGFKTPNPLLWTATPTFGPFTVGAWPSNYTPQNNDTVTIYVLCRTQPKDMTKPGQP